MSTTSNKYKEIIDKCKEIFFKKNKDYGPSWTILRPSSITDQIFIKVKRVRNIEQGTVKLIEDSIFDEYMSIVNYCIIAQIICQNKFSDFQHIDTQELEKLYDFYYQSTFELMINKNNDYGEVWKDMRPESITDLILSKVYRIKQIEDNQGSTLISEGVIPNFQDIMNYSIFYLIKLQK